MVGGVDEDKGVVAKLNGPPSKSVSQPSPPPPISRGVLQREYRGLKPRNSTQHYAPKQLVSGGGCDGERDLTANLQELTRQNQVLNQKLLQRETEKGKEKERGDAESRQERQQEQQQEQQQEHQQEQRQEQEGETKGENTRITVEESSAKWEQEMKTMRVQMGEMKDEFKGRAAKYLDDLVHRTDSPSRKRFNKETLLVDGADDKGSERRPSSRGLSATASSGSTSEPPLLGEIHVITGGMATGGTSRSSRKAYARQIHNVLVTQKTDKKPRLEDLLITFTEEDARKVFHPHDDALVVTLEIAGYSIRRVLIDNGSSTDIIYLMAFQQMKIGKDQLRPIETPLVGFAGFQCLPIWNDHPPNHSRKWDRGDEGRSSNGQRMLLNHCERRVGNEKKTTRIGTSMTKEILDLIVNFLRKNADVFAWSHDDMPGISTEVMPFGLKNAGATYQRLVNKMFHDQIGRNVELYVDDMLVKSKKDEDHLADLKETFQALRRYNMKLNPAKCVFGVSSGKFLGFMVSQRGIEANPDKIKAILEMSPPKIVKKVQNLTGKAAALNRIEGLLILPTVTQPLQDG
uniref:Reverse transcriptase domain-containing protein n=1 Tax=Fagus sylvatica TaxID=28930 RepID=A0A2N9IG75_FAGSY